MNLSTLTTPPVADTLDRLHRAAHGDWKYRLNVAPRYILSQLTRRDFMPRNPSALCRTYAAVTEEEGRFLYLLTRAVGARRVVEFGCSFGISTIYLAAAARDNGGTVVTTEIEPLKVIMARTNLNDAGLGDVATVFEGDALETLRHVEGPIDALFLDGMKHLYIHVLQLLQQRLRPGAVVVADNIDMPSARPYAEFVRGAGSGFTSAALFKRRMEVSYWAGGSQRE